MAGCRSGYVPWAAKYIIFSLDTIRVYKPAPSGASFAKVPNPTSFPATEVKTPSGCFVASLSESSSLPTYLLGIGSLDKLHTS